MDNWRHRSEKMKNKKHKRKALFLLLGRSRKGKKENKEKNVFSLLRKK